MSTERRWWKCAETGRLLTEQPAGAAEWSWVDVEKPDEATLRDLGVEFQLDEMATEDALDVELFPSQQDFGDFLSVCLRMPISDGSTADTTPVLAFLGSDYLVTIHHTRIIGLEFLLDTAQHHLPSLEGGPDRMLARLADVGSRRFEPILLAIDALLLRSEHLALEGEPGSMHLLQPVRHQINELRSVIRPQRSVLQGMVYADSDLLGERARRRLTDVLERHARIAESLEVDRATASSIIDLYRGTIAEQTNEIMKVLTVFSAVLLPMTLIAGIYGMNFANMPELDYRFGYPLVLGIMVAVGLVLWRMFAQRGFVGTPAIPDLAASAASKLAAAATKPARTVGSVVSANLKPLHLHEADTTRRRRRKRPPKPAQGD